MKAAEAATAKRALAADGEMNGFFENGAMSSWGKSAAVSVP